jgi:hypothetical protein
MMKTRFEVKQRPHFEIIDWRDFGNPQVSAIAAPVAPLTPAEIVNDTIPDHPAPTSKPKSAGKIDLDSLPDDDFPDNLS